MSDSFGAAAERLCGAASMLLGWRPAEFWAATPAEVETALRLVVTPGEAPDARTIEELRRQFPDEVD